MIVCAHVVFLTGQVLAFFTARIAQENLESPSPEDILRVLAKNVDAWKSEGQARARLKARAPLPRWVSICWSG